MVERQTKRKTASNSPTSYTGGVTIKSRRELAAMERAGAIVGDTLTLLKKSVEPGITTGELNRIADRNIRSFGAVPTFLGYHGFPAVICASVNEEIVHGIPGKRALMEGDIIKMDVGATIDGFIGDAAISVAVGTVSDAARQLMADTEASLYAGIAAAQPGKRIGDIGAAVEGYAVARGYGVVRQFVGHGVGRHLHERPPGSQLRRTRQRRPAPARNVHLHRTNAEPGHRGHHHTGRRLDRGNRRRRAVRPF